MKDRQFVDVYTGNFLAHWDRVARFTKPIVAAVNGFAVRVESKGLHHRPRLPHFSLLCWPSPTATARPTDPPSSAEAASWP
jgi:hypothetical protein